MNEFWYATPTLMANQFQVDKSAVLPHFLTRCYFHSEINRIFEHLHGVHYPPPPQNPFLINDLALHWRQLSFSIDITCAIE